MRKLRGGALPEPHAVIMTAPGEEAQVDYGDGPMVRDAATGKYRRTWLFVIAFGCSRKSVRQLVWRSRGKMRCELYETAFRCLGGVPHVVVLDSLRGGVHAPEVYDPPSTCPARAERAS